MVNPQNPFQMNQNNNNNNQNQNNRLRRRHNRRGAGRVRPRVGNNQDGRNHGVGNQANYQRVGAPGPNVTLYRFFLTDRQKTVMNKVFPYKNYQFTDENPPVKNPIFRVILSEAYNIITRDFGNRASQFFQIGVSNEYLMTPVHVCRKSNSLNEFTKNKFFTDNFMANYRQPAVGSHFSWCWCHPTACNCNAFGNYDFTYFINSIYHFTPAEVAQMLLRAPRSVGYSLHVTSKTTNLFDCDEPEATFYYNNGHVTYQMSDEAVPETAHSIEWIDKNFVLVTAVPVPTYIVIKKFPLDMTGQVALVKLELVRGIGCLPPVEMPVIPPLQPLIPDDEIDRVVVGMKYKRAPLTWVSDMFVIQHLSENGWHNIQIPREILISGMRWQIGKPIRTVNSKLAGYLKSIVSKTTHGVYYDIVIEHLPLLCAVIASQCAQAMNNVAPFHDNRRIQQEIRVANDTLLGIPVIDYPLFAIAVFVGVAKLVMLMLELPIELRIIGSILLLLIIPIYYYLKFQIGLYCLANNYRRNRLYTLFIMFIIIGITSAKDTVEVAVDQTSSYMNQIFKMINVVLFTIIIIMLLPRKVKTQVDNWDEFRNVIMTERRTYPVNVSIPFGSGLPQIESTLDVSNIKLQSDIQYSIQYVDTEKYERNTDGVLAVGICFCTAVPGVFSTSQNNLIKGLTSRVLLEIAPPELEYFDVFHYYTMIQLEYTVDANIVQPITREYTYTVDFLTYTAVWTPYELDDYDGYIKRFIPSKRNALNKAIESFLDGDEDGFYYKCFIKREKQMLFTKSRYVPAKPRVIQGVCPHAKAAFGLWFVNYSLYLKFTWNINNQIWYCCGATTDEFKYWINYHIDRLGGADNVYVFCTDFSKYDVTQGELMIKSENQWYKMLGFCNLPGANEFLEQRLYARVYGKGVKFSVPGTRKSGDNDTSSGNTRTTGMVMSFFLLLQKIKEYAMVVLGDDNFCLIPRRYINSFMIFKQRFIEHCRRLGFIAKVQIEKVIIKAEFISCRFYPTSDGFIIGKKPGNVLTKLGWILKKATTKYTREYANSLLLAIIKSYLPTATHVPFLRTYLQVVSNYLESRGVTPATDLYELQYKIKGTVYLADEETEVAFEECYGISVHLEKEFKCKLISAIEQFGLPCLIDSEIVDGLFSVDNAGVN